MTITRVHKFNNNLSRKHFFKIKLNRLLQNYLWTLEEVYLFRTTCIVILAGMFQPRHRVNYSIGYIEYIIICHPREREYWYVHDPLTAISNEKTFVLTSERMAQLLRRKTSCFEPPGSGFTWVQFPVNVKLRMSLSSTMKPGHYLVMFRG